MALCVSGRRKVSSRLLHPLFSARNVHLPVFLCPGLASKAGHLLASQPRSTAITGRKQLLSSRNLHTKTSGSTDEPVGKRDDGFQLLPLQCTGCGALSQTSELDEAGYFNMARKTVKEFVLKHQRSEHASKESEIINASLAALDPALRKTLELDLRSPIGAQKNAPPVCDRCHRLLHHHTGVSIAHPTIQSIQETLFETPHKYNHVYHVIDAADFPMSLIPGIHRLLHITEQRSNNRRSKTGRFYHDRKTEVSFIITRSDLLAPVKQQVDRMMPYLVDVLRSALGSAGENVRLGNVRCVSSRRGWWTRELKETVYERGGAGWMVGKVNVGKSQLFECIFPKGRRGDAKHVPTRSIELAGPMAREPDDNSFGESTSSVEPLADLEQDMKPSKAMQALDTSVLLPPLPKEVDYPEMPLVSSLPGTTASPIRIPFGDGKGELIDLPGLSRGNLEQCIQEEHRESLIMKTRVMPIQQVLKPGQSLLLGGFIRITPTTPDLIFLAYSFTPLDSHLTSTEKAIGIQTRTREATVENIASETVAEKIKSAGKFRLQWDVTKKRTGPITAKDAANLKPDVLPYRVMSADILIEGCGWVELVCQVRKRAQYKRVEFTSTANPPKKDGSTSDNGLVAFKPLLNERTLSSNEDDMQSPRQKTHEALSDVPEAPEVEIFTPHGRFVGIRKPMGAWSIVFRKPPRDQKGRPRKSMKGDKKNKKRAVRATAAPASM